jgi:hypothetical protein
VKPAWTITCDESNNPPEAIARSELHVDIELRPLQEINRLLRPVIEHQVTVICELDCLNDYMRAKIRETLK